MQYLVQGNSMYKRNSINKNSSTQHTKVFRETKSTAKSVLGLKFYEIMKFLSIIVTILLSYFIKAV